MRMVQKGVRGLTKASFRRKRSYSCCENLIGSGQLGIGTRTECQSTNMSTSKGSHSSLMSPALSIHTNLSHMEDLHPSLSDPLTPQTTPSSFTQIGGKVQRNELCHGEPALFPPNAERFATSTSLQSKVAPESLLESPPPKPKVLRIARADFNVLIGVLDQYRRHVERIALGEQRTNT